MKRLIPLYAAIAIPLTSPTGWQELSFRGIAPNKVNFMMSGLSVDVMVSGSPLIYPLEKPLKVAGFKVRLEIKGEMKPSKNFPEDAYFRMGLIVPGNRRLNAVERMLAPAWLNHLFTLAPQDSGLDKVLFFNLSHDPTWVGKQRVLPKSKDLIREHVIAHRKPEQQEVIFEHRLDEPVNVAALWLSLDGDDSKSSYSVHIHSLELITP